MQRSRATLVHLLPDAPARTLWRVEGRHRARFLHAMTTAEIQKRAPGDCGFACVMSSTGKHAGQLRFEVEAGSILLSGEAVGMAGALEVLTKHRVADDVRWQLDPLAESTSTLAFTCNRDDASNDAANLASLTSLVAHLFGEAPTPGTWRDRAWGETPVRVSAWSARESELGRASYLVRVGRDAARGLLDAAEQLGADPVGAILWEDLRIGAGWPRDGVDLVGDDTTIAAPRLVATISESKGCFLGQEVFVMARDLGQTPRRLVLVGLEGAPDAALAGTTLAVGGAPVGRLGSRQGSHALAMVKRKFATEGTELVIDGGGTARIRPFATT